MANAREQQERLTNKPRINKFGSARGRNFRPIPFPESSPCPGKRFRSGNAFLRLTGAILAICVIKNSTVNSWPSGWPRFRPCSALGFSSSFLYLFSPFSFCLLSRYSFSFLVSFFPLFLKPGGERTLSAEKTATSPSQSFEPYFPLHCFFHAWNRIVATSITRIVLCYEAPLVPPLHAVIQAAR